MAIFIHNAHVITMDAVSGAKPIVLSIRIEDGIIAAIGAGLSPAPGDQIIDGSDRLITPGFVNAHTHSWEMFYKEIGRASCRERVF